MSFSPSPNPQVV